MEKMLQALTNSDRETKEMLKQQQTKMDDNSKDILNKIEDTKQGVTQIQREMSTIKEKTKDIEEALTVHTIEIKEN